MRRHIFSQSITMPKNITWRSPFRHKSGARVNPELPPDTRCPLTPVYGPGPEPPPVRIVHMNGGKFEWLDMCGSPTSDNKGYRAHLRKELQTHNVHTTFIKDLTKPLLLPQCSVARELGGVWGKGV